MSEPVTSFEDLAPEEDEVEWDDQLDQGEIADMLGFDLSGESGDDRSGLLALVNSALVYRRAMPMLDVVFDRAARGLTSALRQLANENVDIRLDDVSALRLGEFLSSSSSGCVVAVLGSRKLHGACLLALDGDFVFSLIDVLLGARRDGAALSMGERGFTKIELGLVEGVVGALVSALNDAFDVVGGGDFKLERLETTTRFAAIAQDQSVCSLAKYQVAMDGRGGRIAWLVPHAALEPIQAILSRAVAAPADDSESRWRERLADAIRDAGVDCRAVIGETTVALRTLSALKVGDTLTLNAKPDGTARIRAGDCDIASAAVGRIGESIALRLAVGPCETSLEDEPS